MAMVTDTKIILYVGKFFLTVNEVAKKKNVKYNCKQADIP